METSSAQTNVDPDEVRKFGSLAEQWWDPKGELRTLHQINPIRIDYVERFARLDGAEALDLGCGGGIVSEGLARRGAKVLGADMAEESVAIARAHCQGQNLNVSYVRASAEELARDMPGRSHLVLSAVCVSTAHFEKADLSVSEVSFDALSDETIDAYLDLGEYAGKAGAYAIQGAAQVFVKKISGSHSGVMGLPLREAAALIAEAARSRAENGGPSVP